MRRKTQDRRVVAACGFLALALAGCGIGVDALNPSLLAQLGIDPNSVRQSSGVVLVTFTNQTTQDAEFQYFTAKEGTDLSKGVETASDFVAPGESSTIPLFCPFGLFTLGTVGDNFTPTTVGAILGGGGGQQGQQVNYTGAPLQTGADFVCGDLIKVTLVQTTAGDQASNFTFQIQVVPGR